MNWETRTVDGIARLHREFKFDDFVQALAFTNRVGDLAEKNGHHPLITTEWGRVIVEWWTHTEKGISARDRDLAEKTDALYR